MASGLKPDEYDNPSNSNKDTRTFIMQKLNAAQLNLQEAYKAGMEKNAMVQDVPAFLEMQQLAKDISAVMQKVARVRGL